MNGRDRYQFLRKQVSRSLSSESLRIIVYHRNLNFIITIRILKLNCVNNVMLFLEYNSVPLNEVYFIISHFINLYIFTILSLCESKNNVVL